MDKLKNLTKETKDIKKDQMEILKQISQWPK